MNIREAAEQIKRTVPMDDILPLYGMELKRDRFMSCPFHSGDHTASLKVYNGTRGWSCFGCHAGGTVIDFVMKMEDLDFVGAVKKIDSELNLHLVQPLGFSAFFKAKADDRLLRQEYAEYRARIIAENREREWIHEQLHDIYMDIINKAVQDRTADDWTWLLNLQDSLPEEELEISHNRQR